MAINKPDHRYYEAQSALPSAGQRNEIDRMIKMMDTKKQTSYKAGKRNISRQSGLNSPIPRHYICDGVNNRYCCLD